MLVNSKIEWIKIYYNDLPVPGDQAAAITITSPSLTINKNKRVTGRELGVTWTSQSLADTDLTGQGLTVGPDGIKDVKLVVGNLSIPRDSNGNRDADHNKGTEKDWYAIYLADVPIGSVKDPASGRLLVDRNPQNPSPWDFKGWRYAQEDANYRSYRSPSDADSFSNGLLMNRRAMAGTLANITEQADFYFSPPASSLAGRPLTMIVEYRKNPDRVYKYDVVAVTGQATSATDPWNNYGTWTAPTSLPNAVTWAGQDSDGNWGNNHSSFASAGVRPGDVRLNLTGVAASAISGAVLSNQHGSVWNQGGSNVGRLTVVADPSNSNNSVLFFPPARNESRADLNDPGADPQNRNARLTLRFTVNGSSPRYTQFDGGYANLSLRKEPTIPASEQKTIEVKWASDNTVEVVDGGGSSIPNSTPITLSNLVSATNYSEITRIRFQPGTYTFTNAVEIQRPVAFEATSTNPAATVLKWTNRIATGSRNPIVIKSSDVRLRGLTIRHDVAMSPTTWQGNFNDRTDALVFVQAGLVDVEINNLRLIGPAASSSTSVVPRNPPLIWAENSHGTITKTHLRGGATYLTGGPWTVTENIYRGARPNTLTMDAFVLRETHDLAMLKNEAFDDLAFPDETGAGRTYRFLEMGVSDRGNGFGNLVAENKVNEQGPNRSWIGYRTQDTYQYQGHDGNNRPELIVSESYYPFYEGSGYQPSADRQTLRLSYRVGKPIKSGDIVAILDGPYAGQWIRVAQAIDNINDPEFVPISTLLLDRSLPGSGRPAIAIHRGFVDTAFRDNVLNLNNSSLAPNRKALVLPGNHYNLEVKGNEFHGAIGLRVASYYTQFPEPDNNVGDFPAPNGWTRTPMLDVRIQNNIFVDAGLNIGGSYEFSPTPLAGRRYFQGVMTDNTFRWENSAPPSLKMGLMNLGMSFPEATYRWVGDGGSILTFERNWSDNQSGVNGNVDLAKLSVHWGRVGPAGAEQELHEAYVDLPKGPPSSAFSAVALNQDGADLVGKGTATGPNGYQDLHFLLRGLDTTRDVAWVSISGTNPGFYSVYNAPFGTNNTSYWRAELVRAGRSSEAHLYAEPGGVIEAVKRFTITVTYADGSTQVVDVYGVSVADPNLPVPTSSAMSAMSINTWDAASDPYQADAREGDDTDAFDKPPTIDLSGGDVVAPVEITQAGRRPRALVGKLRRLGFGSLAMHSPLGNERVREGVAHGQPSTRGQERNHSEYWQL